jgi:hypothetical protein
MIPNGAGVSPDSPIPEITHRYGSAITDISGIYGAALRSHPLDV